MALNFPDSPSVNDIFTSGSSRWQWDGSSWVRQGSAGAQGAGCLLYTSPSPRDRG